MTREAEAFGAAPFTIVQDSALRSGVADMELIRESLAALRPAGGGELNLSLPQPTAAFSRRDSLRGGYPEAQTALASRGFSPVIRPVGGHLAVYGPGDLVIHMWAPHPTARAHIRERFELFGNSLSRGLRELGVDARVGPVPGEYCNGEFSVNVSDRAKLAGTGQRITKYGYLFSAVVMVEDAGPARAALGDAYSMLDLGFLPETVGCVADTAPGTTVEDAREAIASELRRLVKAGPSGPSTVISPCQWAGAPVAGRATSPT